MGSAHPTEPTGAPLVTALYGVHPVAEELRRLAGSAAGTEADRLTLLVARDNAAVRRLQEQARRLGIAVRRVGVAELTARCGTGAHRGVGLERPRSRRRPARGRSARDRRSARAAPAATLADHLAVLERPAGGLVVVADGVTDPVNLGTIARCADQFAVDLLLVPRRRAAPVTAAVMQASAGAAAHVATLAVPNLARALEQLKAAGFWIYGADLEGEPLDRVQFPDRVALVVGSEGGGMHPLVVRRCDQRVRIPTAGTVDSLNVGVAGGILMYEVRRQQRAADARQPPGGVG